MAAKIIGISNTSLARIYIQNQILPLQHVNVGYPATLPVSSSQENLTRQTMPALNNYNTMFNDCPSCDREFVVACKSHPFNILTAPNSQTPAVTLVDFNLVRDLKLRMTDLQCAKFQYGGQKLRICGKISTTVQSIQNMHFKATVVQVLYHNFDTHSIAGQKLSQILIDPPY